MKKESKANVSVIFLAGGSGERMLSKVPKQFLILKEKPIFEHSLEVFLAHSQVREVIVVCKEEFFSFFSKYSVSFAEPGKRRMDSVYNGFKRVCPDSEYICIHDAVRPFISEEMLDSLFEEGRMVGAATLGTPVKSTIKQVDENQNVSQTYNRELTWEIQTPQFINRKILETGFEIAREKQLTVTDDVSLAELSNFPVKVIKGTYQNIKITTPEDLLIAECINTNLS